MRHKWPLTPLGEVLTERRETPSEEDLVSGRVRIIEKISFDTGRIQLRSNGTTRTGMILVRPGDLVVSGINAAKGAIAIYDPDATEPVAATIHYAAYIPNLVRVDVRFLWWMLRSRFFQELLNEYLPGGIKTELKAKRLLPVPVPMPPLAEQRRIVARIEELAAQIEEARRLRREALEAAQAVNHSAMSAILHRLENSPSTERGPICQFAEVNPRRSAEARLSANEPVSFVPMRAVDDVSGTIATPETRLFAEVSKGYTCFREGDVIWARITPCMQNGKSAIARNLVNGVGFGSTEFHVLRPGPKIIAEWLHALVRHKAFLEEAAELFKGTAGQQRVPESFLKAKVITVPPLPVQRRIVAELDALQAEVDRLKALQAEAAAELDALLPAILDRAFKGEL